MMILLFDPEHYRSDVHERTPLQAAEEYELQRALREADELCRAERKAARKLRRRRYLPSAVRRVSAAKP